jgi:hypothetical protein
MSEVKESFCGACIAGIGALAGIGTSGGSRKSKNKKAKRIIFWIGVSITVISIFFLLYLLFIKKCGECM